VEEDVRRYKSEEAASGRKASPLAARVAADLGMDLDKVQARDRVLAEDILHYLSAAGGGDAEGPREELIPMTGMAGPSPGTCRSPI
jgi:hypothetical protein